MCECVCVCVSGRERFSGEIYNIIHQLCAQNHYASRKHESRQPGDAMTTCVGDNYYMSSVQCTIWNKIMCIKKEKKLSDDAR